MEFKSVDFVVVAITRFRGLNSTQFDRCPPRFFGRHARTRMVFDLFLSLALELVVLALLVEEATKPQN